MNRDQALAKIKKCLSLGKSANPNEAATAMRHAQKLMAEHEVTDRELSLLDVVEVRVKACSTAMNLWESALAGMIADAFGCETFSSLTGKYNASLTYIRERCYVFVGCESAPNVAGYAFEVLSRQCAKARLAHIQKQPKNCKPITKTARGDEFAKGWVWSVTKLIDTFANPERNEQLLVAYLDDKYPSMKNSKARDSSKGRKQSGHQHAGYEAGKNAELNRGVGALQQGLLT